jgi:hypothetical protein
MMGTEVEMVQRAALTAIVEEAVSESEDIDAWLESKPSSTDVVSMLEEARRAERAVRRIRSALAGYCLEELGDIPEESAIYDEAG